MCEGTLERVGSDMGKKELTREIIGIAPLGEGLLKEGGTLALMQGSNSIFLEEFAGYTLRRSTTRIEGKRTVTYVVCMIYDDVV
jgi:hypothetical protein